MLTFQVIMNETFDEETNKFGVDESFTVVMEHSLVSLSKWESLWEKSFLSTKDKTQEETLSYVKMMIIGDDLPPAVFSKLVTDHLSEINRYISAKMTATTFASDSNASDSRGKITAEIIYYWMISMNVPMECEMWHLNRLLTLIRVITLKNTPKKKMTAAERRNLNRQRLSQYNTRG